MRPTIAELAELLETFERENDRTIAGLPDVGDPDRFVINAGNAIRSLDAHPWRGQNAAGRAAWKTMALMGAYALLRAVYAANTPPRARG